MCFSRLSLQITALGIFTATASYGVIVSGVSGTGNNNDTQSGLDSYLGGTAFNSFNYWDNLIKVGSSSGVYLGQNNSTSRGWVLAAQHVSPPSQITVAGNTYTVNGSRIQMGSSDLVLYEIGGGTDPALPPLPTVPLASSTAVSGEDLLMFGRGFTTTSSSTAPYTWGNDGNNPANTTRWGTNTVEFLQAVDIDPDPIGTNLQPYIFTDFDSVASGQATEFEAQAAVHDSGGGLFIYRSGVWELSGIAHFVVAGADGDSATNPSEYSDQSGYSDVFAYRNNINSTTGTLVPEPSTFFLTAPALLLLLRRKR